MADLTSPDASWIQLSNFQLPTYFQLGVLAVLLQCLEHLCTVYRAGVESSPAQTTSAVMIKRSAAAAGCRLQAVESCWDLRFGRGNGNVYVMFHAWAWALGYIESLFAECCIQFHVALLGHCHCCRHFISVTHVLALFTALQQHCTFPFLFCLRRESQHTPSRHGRHGLSSWSPVTSSPPVVSHLVTSCFLWDSCRRLTTDMAGDSVTSDLTNLTRCVEISVDDGRWFERQCGGASVIQWLHFTSLAESE